MASAVRHCWSICDRFMRDHKVCHVSIIQAHCESSQICLCRMSRPWRAIWASGPPGQPMMRTRALTWPRRKLLMSQKMLTMRNQVFGEHRLTMSLAACLESSAADAGYLDHCSLQLSSMTEYQQFHRVQWMLSCRRGAASRAASCRGSQWHGREEQQQCPGGLLGQRSRPVQGAPANQR